MSDYGEAILEAHRYLLSTYPKVFAIGQGLWSPWYVGNTMTDLEADFGKERIIDTPVSEQACSGAALGAALCGYRPIMTHPRVDFALLAVDQIVNQAAKWSSMFGGKVRAPVTFRCIVNRGGEQGAQHSQSLHSFFAQVPGLRVVMPASPKDARDLLIASVLCDDPVIYMDDRWLYDLKDELPEIRELDLTQEGPEIVARGTDLTIVGAGYSAYLCVEAAKVLEQQRISCEVIDIRVASPLAPTRIVRSVEKTGRMLVVDGDAPNCGLASSIITSVAEVLSPECWKARPRRVTLPHTPAPTSSVLEASFYPTREQIVAIAEEMARG